MPTRPDTCHMVKGISNAMMDMCGPHGKYCAYMYKFITYTHIFEWHSYISFHCYAYSYQLIMGVHGFVPFYQFYHKLIWFTQNYFQSAYFLWVSFNVFHAFSSLLPSNSKTFNLKIEYWKIIVGCKSLTPCTPHPLLSRTHTHSRHCAAVAFPMIA